MRPIAAVFAAALAGFALAGAADTGSTKESRYGLGRAPTAEEVRAWDIDVRADFAGLPKGAGSVERGQAIWDEKCASCHGVFGESNEFFNPIVGGTDSDDQKKGNVRSLTTSELQRTTMMKLSSLGTLWDYIRRAMPWTAPKSLSSDDVYAVTAYILHLADVVPAGFVLTDANIRDTERLLPNRNGMTRNHGLWSIRGQPDVHNTACMIHCGPEPRVESLIPDFARNAHGNLAEQNRTFGAVRGLDTTRPGAAGAVARIDPDQQRVVSQAPRDGAVAAPATLAVATRLGCTACHAVDRKIVGPSFREVSARHATSAGATARLAASIRSGSVGQWGTVPMPAQPQVSAADAAGLAAWIAAGAGAR